MHNKTKSNPANPSWQDISSYQQQFPLRTFLKIFFSIHIKTSDFSQDVVENNSRFFVWQVFCWRTEAKIKTPSWCRGIFFQRYKNCSYFLTKVKKAFTYPLQLQLMPAWCLRLAIAGYGFAIDDGSGWSGCSCLPPGVDGGIVGCNWWCGKDVD